MLLWVSAAWESVNLLTSIRQEAEKKNSAGKRDGVFVCYLEASVGEKILLRHGYFVNTCYTSQRQMKEM